MLDELKDARRVLAVRLDNIGDVVMLTPALTSLKAALPEARLTLMASPAGAQVAPMLASVDDTIVVRALWQDASGRLGFSPEREQALIARIAEERFDAAFIFTSFSQSPHPPGYVCYLAGVPLRIGQSKEFGGGVLSHTADGLPDEAHQVERNLSLLGRMDVPVVDDGLRLDVPDEVLRKAEGLLAGAGVDSMRPYVVVAPGASCRARAYPPDRWSAVLDGLVRQVGMPVVLVGTEGETVQVAGDMPIAGLVSLGGRTTVPELAAVIAGASLVVANNSAPMHIAEAFQRPTVVTYSGTDLVSQWRPRKAPARILRKPTACSPCYGFACPFDLECLDIPPKMVVDNAMALLSECGHETAPIQHAWKGA